MLKHANLIRCSEERSIDPKAEVFYRAPKAEVSYICHDMALSKPRKEKKTCRTSVGTAGASALAADQKSTHVVAAAAAPSVVAAGQKFTNMFAAVLNVGEGRQPAVDATVAASTVVATTPNVVATAAPSSVVAPDQKSTSVVAAGQKSTSVLAAGQKSTNMVAAASNMGERRQPTVDPSVTLSPLPSTNKERLLLYNKKKKPLDFNRKRHAGDRRFVVSGDSNLIEHVGRLSMQFATDPDDINPDGTVFDTVFVGTGTHVGQVCDHERKRDKIFILTAAHNVVAINEHGLLGTYYARVMQFELPNKIMTVTGYFIYPPYLQNQSAKNDMAVVIARGTIVASTPAPTITHRFAKQPPAFVSVVGYPAESEILLGMVGPCQLRDADVLEYNIDTTGGQSGSPVLHFNKDDGGYIIQSIRSMFDKLQIKPKFDDEDREISAFANAQPVEKLKRLVSLYDSGLYNDSDALYQKSAMKIIKSETMQLSGADPVPLSSNAGAAGHELHVLTKKTATVSIGRGKCVKAAPGQNYRVKCWGTPGDEKPMILAVHVGESSTTANKACLLTEGDKLLFLQNIYNLKDLIEDLQF